MRRNLWLVFGIVVVLAFLVYLFQHQNPSTPAGNAGAAPVSLQLVAQGGFAFVYTPDQHMLEIGFMKGSNTAACTVPQETVSLVVDKGDILEPASPPADKTFDVAGATITLDSASAATQTLTANGLGKPGDPFHPADVETDDGWKDLQWLANVTANGPSNKIASDWRTRVNGRMVLTSGTIRAGKPTDTAAAHGTWEFKNSAQPGTVVSKQAISDRAIYTVDLPGPDVVLNLAGAASGVSKIRIRPTTGNKVNVMLMGGHPSSAPAHIPVGARIDHFCSFYLLMDPVPDPAQWLYPHFAGLNAGTPLASGSTQAQANPGFYCPGDMF